MKHNFQAFTKNLKRFFQKIKAENKKRRCQNETRLFEFTNTGGIFKTIYFPSVFWP
jgi:hypothetical protein